MLKPVHLILLLLFILAGACTADQSIASSVLTKGEEDELINRYMTQLVANPESQSEKDQNIIVNLLIDSLWDFQRTDSGIYYQIQKAKIPSNGHPGLSSFIRVHYRGTFLNGKEFDSSFKRQEPIEFRPSQVIAGWQEVLPLMKKGEVGTFFIPSELAYGQEGFGRMVPPNAVLKFEIHLLHFEDDPDDGF